MISKKVSGRKSVRSPVSPTEIKGQLANTKGEVSEAVLIWNISDSGLCVWATHKFKHGEVLELRISHPWAVTLNCSVRWNRAIPDRSGVLLGLEMVKHPEELKKLHKAILDQQKIRAG